MSILLNLLYFLLLVNGENEISYRGISITWRRLLPRKSDEIDFEILIIIALGDKSIDLCDSHHSKEYQISSDYGLECLESWDNCLSFPLKKLVFQCRSKSHEYPKSVLSTQINFLNPSELSNVYYKFLFPSKNNSCCWEDIDPSDKSVQLIAYLNLIELDQINNPPIGRFPSHIHLDLKRFHQYSLEIFDPDGDLFECSLKSSIDFLSLSSNCILTLKSSTRNSDIERILIEIEIIEYVNEKKDEIRSRLPYHLVALIDDDSEMNDDCDQVPLINLFNIENNQIHIEINEQIDIELKSMSQCQLEMDECLIQSSFHWKIKLHNEKTNLLNNQNEIDYQFEWIPKLNQHCGYQIHCIRCLDSNEKFIDKCINIFVYGTTCQNANRDHKLCSWSSFSSWSKFNQTTFKRQRTCLETSNHSKTCPFCFGSSLQYQSSLAFIKDFQLFEEYLINPKRAHSTIKIILISSIISIIILVLSIVVCFYLTFQSIWKKKKH